MARSPAIGRPGAAGAHGFTLIEVLLAMSLLAMGLALAFAALRATHGVSARGEAIAERSERMRSVGGFLRRRLAGALPVAHPAASGDGSRPLRFVGEPERMIFVADLPAYLGHGGPYLHELYLAGTGDRRQLQLQLSLLQEGSGNADGAARPPEILVDQVQLARFRYRGLDQQGRLGGWSSSWQWPDRMPLQVEIVVKPATGAPWPTMVVALPHAGSGDAP